LLGNAALAGVGGSLLGGIAAALVFSFPDRRWPLAALAAAAAGLYWHEAPIVGNHLLLLALVAAAVALESFVGGSPARVVAAARLSVLVFYGYAAFAKLNEGFFDPDTSCAPFYLGESARSLNLPDPTSTEAVRWIAIVVTAAIEAAIPVLLLVRRTRTFGVVLALVFHAVVALDRTHQFFDFSAVLSVVFVTFLPAVVLTDAAGRLSRTARPTLVRVGAPLAAVLAGLVAAIAADRGDRTLALDTGWWVWQATGAIVGIALGGALLAHRRTAPAQVSLLPGAGLAVVAVVAINGALPYLEVKTATGWTMYANLRTVDGDSNHFLVRATLPLTDPQDDLVTIVSTEDPVLAMYAANDLALPVRTLRGYLQEQDRPIDAVLDVGGDRVVLAAGEPIPERLGPPVPEWLRRLFVLRSVSTTDGVPCQDAYFGAT
jgi:hypothetical protein